MGEKPKRIQLKRVKGWRKPEGAVVVTRATKWGNPFKVGDPGITDSGSAVYRFRLWMSSKPDGGRAWAAELRGKDLCCFCPLNQPCHADVLLELANPR